MNNNDEFLATPATALKRRSIGPKFNLLTVFLVVGNVACWTAYSKLAIENRQTQSKYALLQGLARELVVDDDSRIVAVRKKYAFFGSAACEVFIPEGPPQKLHYLSRDLQLQTGNSASSEFFELTPGRHVIEYQKEMNLVTEGSFEKQLSQSRLLIDERFESEKPVFDWLGSVGGADGAIDELTIGERGKPFVIVGTGPNQQRLMWLDNVTPSSSDK